MGAAQAQTMMTQLMQQLMGGQFANQQMANLQGAGLGKVKGKKIFQSNPDEDMMRQAVMQRVLGFYGGGQLPSFGGPQQGPTQGPQEILPGFGMPMQRGLQGTGGGQTRFAPGMPEDLIYTGAQGGESITRGGGGMPNFGPPSGLPQEDIFGGGLRDQGGLPNISTPSLDGPQRPFTSGANSVEEMINNLWNQNQAQSSMGNVPVASQNPWEQIGLGGGLPNLDPRTQSQLGAIFQPQIDQMNADFGEQKNAMLQDLFGRGMAQSSAAGDVGGKLLTGRSTALNQIQGQKAQAELALRQQLMEQIGSKAGAGAFSGGSNLAGGMGGANSPAASMLSSVLHDISGSDRALNFDQRMQQAELELKKAALAQEGSLSGRGLDIQQMLGLGSQGLQGQGLSQDLMMQLLGMGQQRQQSMAGLESSERARMQQYLMGQQGLGAQIGSQQAQMEAQRRGLFSQIMGGLLGGVSSLAGAAASGGMTIPQFFGR